MTDAAPAGIVTTLATAGALHPLHVFLIATVSGLIRPSDQTSATR